MKVKARHPAEVTSDRLIDHVLKWPEKFTNDEKAALGLVRSALIQIAEGAR